MKKISKKLVIAGALSLCSLGATAGTNLEASSDMMKSSMDAMHEMHMMKVTGNTDRDFVTGMIPHHEGAIVMSEKILPHLKDAEIRKFAENVIKAQKEEIKFMEEWLAKNPASK
ncbi:DUF305 domain-containing protein [Vibrio splendidus]|nr:DUF305 domain-containing protein [Vibrio splendidus]MCC4880315.1 DUF305 domain-containing protein [Vibrio splendidus]